MKKQWGLLGNNQICLFTIAKMVLFSFISEDLFWFFYTANIALQFFHFRKSETYNKNTTVINYQSFRIDIHNRVTSLRELSSKRSLIPFLLVENSSILITTWLYPLYHVKDSGFSLKLSMNALIPIFSLTGLK